MNGRSLYKRNARVIEFLVRFYSCLPSRLRLFLYSYFFNGDWFLPAAIRYLSFRTLCKSCGPVLKIGASVKVKNWQGLSIGNCVNIHEQCYIDALGGIAIGDNVSIAHSTSVLSFEHTWENLELPIKYNPLKKERVVIENDVWVGCGVRILAGVNIGDRTIIAAGAVLPRGKYLHAIYAGIPARNVKDI
jgi:acetyltransferase-like isoleucine patch superfamily enzyme